MLGTGCFAHQVYCNSIVLIVRYERPLDICLWAAQYMLFKFEFGKEFCDLLKLGVLPKTDNNYDKNVFTEPILLSQFSFSR